MSSDFLPMGTAFSLRVPRDIDLPVISYCDLHAVGCLLQTSRRIYARLTADEYFWKMMFWAVRPHISLRSAEQCPGYRAVLTLTTDSLDTATEIAHFLLRIGEAKTSLAFVNKISFVNKVRTGLQLARAESLIQLCQYQTAEQLLTVICLATDLTPAETATVHYLSGTAMTRVNRMDEAEMHLRTALAMFETLFGESDRRTLRGMNQLGSCLYFGNLKHRGDPTFIGSIMILERCRALAVATYGAESEVTLDAMDNLSRCYHAKSSWGASVENLVTSVALMDDVIAASNHVLGLRHPMLALRYSIMGGLLYTAQRSGCVDQTVRRDMSRSAATWVSEALLMARAAVGPDHALYAYCLEWFCIAAEELDPSEKIALNTQAGKIRMATGTKKFDSGI